MARRPLAPPDMPSYTANVRPELIRWARTSAHHSVEMVAKRLKVMRGDDSGKSPERPDIEVTVRPNRVRLGGAKKKKG